MRVIVRIMLAVLALAVAGGSAYAEESGETAPSRVPRFVSLGKDEIFVRTGPALQYPIRWVYRKRGLPVEVIREYDTWRQIRDVDGAVGWVHHAMLSSYRSAVITVPDGVMANKSPETGAAAVVRLEKGVVVALDECDPTWCKVRISGFKGWVPRSSLWGIYPSEEIH